MEFGRRDELPQNSVKASSVRFYFHVLTVDEVIEVPHRCRIMSRGCGIKAVGFNGPSFRVPDFFVRCLVSTYPQFEF